VGINPVDYKRRQNGPYTNFPVVLGWDVSGVVDALGDGVTDVQVGDDVYGMIRFPDEGRAYAEYVTAPATHLARKPASLSHVEAAATTLAPLTALQVFEKMNLQAGPDRLDSRWVGGCGALSPCSSPRLGARG
jgi:NADPH:quinone reductase-like Zn-dependent oxidoreductase